jgi:hypothetical protein
LGHQLLTRKKSSESTLARNTRDVGVVVAFVSNLIMSRGLTTGSWPGGPGSFVPISCPCLAMFGHHDGLTVKVQTFKFNLPTRFVDSLSLPPDSEVTVLVQCSRKDWQVTAHSSTKWPDLGVASIAVTESKPWALHCGAAQAAPAARRGPLSAQTRLSKRFLAADGLKKSNSAHRFFLLPVLLSRAGNCPSL